MTGETPAATQTKAGEVQSVHRALDLLESVGRTGESGRTALADELGLATSTVHHLVRGESTAPVRRPRLTSDDRRPVLDERSISL